MKIDKRYRIIERISKTQNNILYKVADTQVDEVLALKLLKNSEPDFVSQFKKEYFILQTFTHPNIVKVYDFCSFKKEGKDNYYFTMEYVKGVPFNLYFLKNNYSRFLSLFHDTLNVLGFIHRKGYLHCDLKPSHILIDKDGKIKLVDFGFAQFQKVIVKKEIGGTLRYIAPEILRGEKPDVRTDIYSMGIIGYESLTGKEAFDERKTSKILNAVLNKNLQPIEKKNNYIPTFLNDVILRMSDKLRLNRFTSFESVIEVIQQKGKCKKEEKYIEKVLYSDFIGRKKYIASVYNLIDRVDNGEGQILLIEGVSGTGKTRLLKEIEHRLFIDGKDVQYIRITERGKFNFNWLIELLERAGADLSYLKRMLKKGKITLSEKGKYRFFEKITKEMLKIPRNKIHIFLLDDIDFNDKRMVDFFLYLSNFLEENPFLFITATENIPESFDRIIKGKIYRNVSNVKLNGLNKNEALLFVKNMLGTTENTEKISDYLYKNTAGNPYFIEELLREIVERRLLKKEVGNLVYDLADIKKVPIPDSVGIFIKERIGKLSPEEKEILKLVSVFGDSIPLSRLVNLSAFNESETIGICEGSPLKQFLSVSERDNLDFTHRVVKSIVYDSLKEEEKIIFHKRILRNLESLKETPYILNLKSIHSSIIKGPEAASYLHKLLKRSIKYFDTETAINAFEKLQELHKVDVLFKTDKEILLKIGNFYYHAGKFDKAISLYNKLLQKVTRKSERVKVLHYLAMTKMVVSQYDEAEEIFNALLREKLSLDQRYKILTDLGWFYYIKKAYKKAEEIYGKALVLSKKGLKKKVLLAKLFYNLAILKRQTNKLVEAKSFANKVYDIGKQSKNKFYITAGLNMLAILEQIKRKYDKAITYYKKTQKILQKTEDLPRRLHVLTNLARVLFLAGDIEESKKYYFNAIFEAKKLGNLYNISSLYNLYGRMLSKNAEWKGALDFLESSSNIAKSINEYLIQLSNLTEISFIYAFQGKIDKFTSLMNTALSLKKYVKNERELLQVDLLRGIQKYTICDFNNALLYLNRVEETIGKLNVPEYQIQAMIYKSLCLLKSNKRESALKTIYKAKEIMDNSKMFLYKEETQFAELLIQAEDLSHSKIMNQFSSLLNKTRKNQRFLYARILAALSNIKYKMFLAKKRRNYLLDSISLLSETSEIFNKINAQPLISEVNYKLVQSFKKLFEPETQIFQERKHLNLINVFCNLVRDINNPEQLKTAFISTAKIITGAERGLFLTLDSDTDELIVTGKDVDDTTIYDARKFSKTVIKRVAKTKKPLIVYDAINEKDYKNFESVRINKIRSVLCIPIITDDEVFGTLYLDSRKTAALFSKQDQEFFSALSTLLAESLCQALDYKRMEDETATMKQHLRTRFGPENLIGRSKIMQEIFHKIEKFAECDVPVLILGESGTGKEVVARSIYSLSKRIGKKFLVMDCSGVSSSLIESELFGYKKGAFTGAGKDTIGHFESADKGTLFIDEIANASDTLQSRLLRFLDSREVKRIGTTDYKKVDTRIIVASNQDLNQLIKSGKFRQDLFHRLSKFVIWLPPLRERKEDIKLLVNFYIDFYNKKYNKNIRGVTDEVFELFYSYDWQGNVRELLNEIARCVFFCNKRFISKEYLSEGISKLKPSFLSFKEMQLKLKNEYIMQVLSFSKGNVSKTARILKIDKVTVYRNIEKNFRNIF